MPGNNPQASTEIPVPSGTVTFLFTDIEGSTQLLERLKEQYATLLEEQRDLLRAAFTRWNGHEMDTQGDAFFVAFPRALDAVRCVSEAQRELAAHTWPQNAQVKVRMGLHTGEPLVARTGYVGMDVHRAARIAAAGYGGQVLVSQATRELIYQDLPPGTGLRDLGEHKLKDIRYPQRIYQLEIAGMPAEFPTLKTLSAQEAPPTPGEPPYKGLQYFDEGDAGWFFGRQHVTAQLVQAVQAQRFLAVIGASGSGKSSVVRAGLVPALKKELPCRWQMHVLTPTASPLEALAVSLTRGIESASVTGALIDDLHLHPRSLHLFVTKLLAAKPSPAPKELLLVVDQFEELFTQCRSGTERQAFVDNLLHAVKVQAGLLRAVITLRADFYEYVAQYPELRELVSKNQEYIGSMSAAELRQAIEEPALRGGWELTPGLVDLILHDVGAAEGRQPEPGALPLLSHALLETWKRRRGNLLTLRAYTEAGGVRAAIARTAERVYNGELDPAQQQIARNIFLRLTELGEGAQDTRRRISIHELIPPGPAGDTELIQDVLVKLADARLITTGEGTVEVAHEALIREWPALREWLAQDREGLRLQRHLTEAAQEWDLLERDPGALYRGARLAQAVEWALANPRQLSFLEQAFMNASQEAAELEQAEREATRQRELEAARRLAEAEHQRADEQARSARRLRRRALSLAVALLVALGLAAATSFFYSQASRNAELASRRQLEAESSASLAAASASDARRQQVLAEAESKARATQQAVAEEERARAEQARADADLSAQEAFARELSQAAEANLGRDPELSMLLALQATSVTQSSSLPTTLGMQDILHRAMQASRARLTITHPGGAFGIDVSPDGTMLATAGNDDVIRLWDAGTGRSIGALSGHAGAVEDVAFSPDGKRLASAGQDATARVWDLANGAAVLTLAGHTAPILFIAYSPDGRLLATTGDDDTVRIWDVSGNSITGRTLVELPGQWANPGFSPDGSRLATTSIEDGKSRVWDASTGEELLVLPGEFGSTVVAFSPDGGRLALEGPELGSVAIFDAGTGAALVSLCCHTARIRAIDFNPDGSLIATAGQEGVAKIWDAGSGRELLTLSGRMTAVDDLVFSPDCGQPPQTPFPGCGRYVYTTSRDGTVKKWDVSPAGDRDLLTARGMIAAFSPDGQLLELMNLFPRNQAAIQTWHLPSAGEPEPLDTYAHLPMPAPISAGDVTTLSGKTTAAVASADGSVQTWEVGKPQSVISYTVPIAASESPVAVFVLSDGLHLATTTEGSATQIWDVPTSRILLSLPAAGRVDASQDGRLLAIGADDGSASVWDAANGDLRLTTAAHDRPIWGIGFSPDGELLATGSMDTTAKVWDLSTGALLFTLGHNSSALSPVFSPDGKRLAVNQGDGSLYIWDVEPHSPTAGQLSFRFTGLDEYANFNGFSPDGRIAFVGSYFGQKIRLYILPLEDLVSTARTRLTRGWTEEECRKYLHVEACPEAR